MPSARDIGASDSLPSGREARVQCLCDVIARKDYQADLVSRCHDAKPASLKGEFGRIDLSR